MTTSTTGAESASTGKRIGDLQPGDLTTHAGGACCAPGTPFRVEELDRWENGRGIEVTWSCTGCGTTFQPLPCSPDCVVTYFGRGSQ
jgi:hypothetical protein